MGLIKDTLKSVPFVRRAVALRNQIRNAKTMGLRNRESKNLIATLYGLQEYYSDIVVDGEYRNVATFTLSIGCPVKCRYCPQACFVAAYRARPNPVQDLSFESFCKMLEKIPQDVIISFTGFVENVKNSACVSMILYALEKGHKVRVYSTMYNATIEQYEAFAHHPNLITFDLHLPDCLGNTVFPITQQYLHLLKHIVSNPPKHATFWTSCLGIDGGVHLDIAHIIQANPNPINSIHGLVYDNYLHHGNNQLSCKHDCSRLDLPQAGVGAILPNGDVVGCTKDWELKHVIGNILQADSWYDIINSPQRQRFRAALTDPSIPSICRTCELAVRVNAGTKIE